MNYVDLELTDYEANVLLEALRYALTAPWANSKDHEILDDLFYKVLDQT